MKYLTAKKWIDRKIISRFCRSEIINLNKLIYSSVQKCINFLYFYMHVHKTEAECKLNNFFYNRSRLLGL